MRFSADINLDEQINENEISMKTVNGSVSKGIMPNVLKTAVVTHLLNKPGLPHEYKTYRPVSNLAFAS